MPLEHRSFASTTSSTASSSSIPLPSVVRRSPTPDPSGRLEQCFTIDFSTLRLSPTPTPATRATPKRPRCSAPLPPARAPRTSLHRATWLGTDVLVKIFHEADDAGRAAGAGSAREALLREVELVSRLRHPGLKLYMGACVDERWPLAIVYEWREEMGVGGVVALEDFLEAPGVAEEDKRSVERKWRNVLAHVEGIVGPKEMRRVRHETLVCVEEMDVVVSVAPCPKATAEAGGPPAREAFAARATR